MNAKARSYCLAIIAAALALLPFQNWAAIQALPLHDLGGLALFIGLAVLSEFLSVNARVGTQQAASSIAFIPFFACILLFPAPAALITAGVTSATAQVLVHRKALLRASFNSSQTVLAIWAANGVFQLLGGHYSSAGKLETLSVLGAVQLLGLSATFFLVNQGLVSVALALISGDRITAVFNRIIAPGGNNLVYDLIASPVAVLIAVLYIKVAGAGLLFGLLPLLIIRHSYASNEKLQQANKDLLTVLVKTIETRDPYTSGHSIRVSILAKAIAEDLGLTATKTDRIETAALVHDIGKVDAVYASIIRKEGSLTDAERKVIVTHAAKGAEFLKTLTTFPSDMLDGVRHHHERFDGSGYPDGLSGEAIPLPARIIQLCDSIDAMLSDRPYRKALSVEHVRGELLRCAGTQFDPKIVEVILKKNTLERAASLVRPDSLAPRARLVASA